MTARDRSIVLVLAVVGVLGAFWMFALKPKRAEAGALSAKVATQTARLQNAQSTVAAGMAAKAGYPRDYATVAELGKAVPADDDMPSLLYQLQFAAHGAHVDFQSLVRSPGDASSSAPSGAGSTAGSPAAASAALPPGATVGTAGLATLPFTFAFSGSFFDLQHFLGDLQRFVRAQDDAIAVRGRLLTVDGVSLVPGDKGFRNLKAKIVATAYLSPATQDPAQGGGAGSAAPATPATTSAAITGGTN